jgi:hypothetical protein
MKPASGSVISQGRGMHMLSINIAMLIPKYPRWDMISLTKKNRFSINIKLLLIIHYYRCYGLALFVPFIEDSELEGFFGLLVVFFTVFAVFSFSESEVFA